MRQLALCTMLLGSLFLGCAKDASETSETKVIAAAGGTVTAGGATLVIPPGALSQDTTITMTVSSPGAGVPEAATVSGSIFELGPDGTTFSAPAMLTLPMAGTPAAGERAVISFLDSASNRWVDVTSTVTGDEIRAPISHFTPFATRFGLEQSRPHLRAWAFQPTAKVPYWGSYVEPSLYDDDDEAGVEVRETFLFGAAEDFFEQDNGETPGLAMGGVYSSESGDTFWVYAEAPSGDPNLPAFRSGGEVHLRQHQSFVKRAPNASLQVVVSAGYLAASDYNGRPDSRECGKLVGNFTDQELIKRCPPIWTEVEFKAEAYTGPTAPGGTKTFFSVHGEAGLFGFGDTWTFFARTIAPSSVPMWTVANFVSKDANDRETLESRDPLVSLAQQRVFDVDLTNVPVCEPGMAASSCGDREFTLTSFVRAETWNWRGRESGAAAYIRDPQNIGGNALLMTGLEATNNPSPLPEPEVAPPIPCATGPDPAAGVLSFSGGVFSAPEPLARAQGIEVTRTGGTKGAVSVTVGASDGTALAGADFTTPAVAVIFGDGDSAPRTVELTLLNDTLAEPDETVNLTLSEPGGCATLGAQPSAVLTIFDDDTVPPPLPIFLDESFGSEGRVSIEFGGGLTAMALQPDGKIVMVGGSSLDFILARFNADGSLDASFGSGGLVTTDLLGGLEREWARGVAIQADGKIVVVGFVDSFPSYFALARYDADGSLDASFGSGGYVNSSIVGIAHAVAIQPADGKIVVVGSDDVEDGDLADFALARYNPDGSLDTSFGTGGQLTTDIAGDENAARNVVLQPNGAIVVSGDIPGNPIGPVHTDIVRYNPNGSLDSSFGAGGKVTLGTQQVGEGLALQGDGKLVLVGSVIATQISSFSLMRLNADGSPDNTFGDSEGTVTTAFAVGTVAKAVALQSDGKIVAAGGTVGLVSPDFMVARYHPDGTLDTGFGNGGNLTINLGYTDIAESVAVQPDGKIVLGGAGDFYGGYALARVLP